MLDPRHQIDRPPQMLAGRRADLAQMPLDDRPKCRLLV